MSCLLSSFFSILLQMFYNYGNGLRNQQKIEDAIIFYEEAIRLHPTYSKAFDNIGVLYDDGSEQGSKIAEKMYQKSIEANPHHPRTVNISRVTVLP